MKYEFCKDCEYSYEVLLRHYNLFPGLEGQTYDYKCKREECIHEEQ